MAKLSVGDKAPNIELMDQNNNAFKLSEHIGKSNIVIFFFPKSETKVCTEQACAFRNIAEDLRALNTIAIGISQDNVETQESFSNNHNLGYPVLSDVSGDVHAKYGAGKVFGLIPRRITYIIDLEGKISYEYEDLFKGEIHVEKVIEFLNKK
jgi:thioredoxin-dependent peroxiredoxin